MIVKAPVIARQRSDISIDFVLDLNAAHAVFEGHFPQGPVLPAVMQLQWAGELIAAEFQPAEWYRPEAITALKFMRVIRPSALLHLKLRPIGGAPLRYEFQYRQEEQLCSTGQLVYGQTLRTDSGVQPRTPP